MARAATDGSAAAVAHRTRALVIIRSVSRETLLIPVHAWRLISRLLPPRCRYYPSCSAYAIGAVRRHGVVYGGALSIWRVLRCNPWSLGGVDPVPPRIPSHPASTNHSCIR